MCTDSHFEDFNVFAVFCFVLRVGVKRKFRGTQEGKRAGMIDGHRKS